MKNFFVIILLLFSLFSYASDYIEIGGVKWAKGWLVYDAIGGGTPGFQENWKVTNDYNFFKGDLDDDSHRFFFTCGVVGTKSLTKTESVHLRHVTDNFSSKMFIDDSLKIETNDFTKACYGDLAYWATYGFYRMPTVEELESLKDNCQLRSGYVVLNDGSQLNGLFAYDKSANVTIKNNEEEVTAEDLEKGIFLPFKGSIVNGHLGGMSNYYGQCWSSSYRDDYKYGNYGNLHMQWGNAMVLVFYGGYQDADRSLILPVYVGSNQIDPTARYVGVKVGDHGKIEYDDQSLSNDYSSFLIHDGENFDFTIVPDSGYRVKDITVDGNSRISDDSQKYQADWSETIYGNTSINVTFEKNPSATVSLTAFGDYGLSCYVYHNGKEIGSYYPSNNNVNFKVGLYDELQLYWPSDIRACYVNGEKIDVQAVNYDITVDKDYNISVWTKSDSDYDHNGDGKIDLHDVMDIVKKIAK